ncbi:MAG: hypothetical protein H0T78_08010 [Longispora sp.]|nr:hypothetical protein [Longispora sp. (in: high G+C Gram-positive bacteria)]
MRYTARTITALTTNPGCDRRGLLDAAGVDKAAFAVQLGFPTSFGQSRFAISRHNAFVERLCADGHRQLLELIELPDAKVLDIDLVLDIAGQSVSLTPDPVLVQDHGCLRVVMIRSFAVIDGQADAGKVDTAAQHAVVFTLALRRSGYEPTHDVLLVCPQNFSNRPAVHRIDIRRQLGVLERQLTRLTPAARHLARLAAGECAEEAAPLIEAMYAPACLTACEMAGYCGEEARARGALDALGRSVRDTLGGLDTIDDVLSLAAGVASTEHSEIAERLVAARAIRAEVGG